MPDIFVPFDSTRYNQLYSSLIRKGIFNAFVNEYLDKNRKKLLKNYPEINDFKNSFVLEDDDFADFIAKAEKEEVLTEENRENMDESFIRLQIKALMARNLYDTGAYFEVLAPADHEINKALEALKDENKFRDLGLDE